MATKVRIELKHDGIRELMCSEPIGNECIKAAEQIAERAGDGFVVLPLMQLGKAGRIGAAVAAESYEAKVAEATDKVLTKAVTG